MNAVGSLVFLCMALAVASSPLDLLRQELGELADVSPAEESADDQARADKPDIGITFSKLQSQLESVRAWHSMQVAHMKAWPLKDEEDRASDINVAGTYSKMQSQIESLRAW